MTLSDLPVEALVTRQAVAAPNKRINLTRRHAAAVGSDRSARRLCAKRWAYFMGAFDNYPDHFRASIRILSYAEGGRREPAHNGLRWDFNYASQDPSQGLYMIWPVFLDETGAPLPADTPLPLDCEIPAQMAVVSTDEGLIYEHRRQLHVGTRFYCCEGLRRVAAGIVTRITGLADQ